MKEDSAYGKKCYQGKEIILGEGGDLLNLSHRPSLKLSERKATTGEFPSSDWPVRWPRPQQVAPIPTHVGQRYAGMLAELTSFMST